MTERKTIQLLGNTPEPVAFAPETPAGQKLAAFLEVFNEADYQKIVRFVDEHFGPPAMLGQAPQERATWARSLHRDTGGLRLSYVGQPHDFDISVFAQAELTGEWFQIQVTVSEEPPHLIEAITTRISQRPPDAGPHPQLTETEITARLSELLLRLVRNDMFSGAVLVAHEDRTIFEYVCGMASLAYGVPNKIDTRFNVGSMCKSFTAVGIAQLAEKGLLAFNDPLSKFLPDYPRKVADKITLHHLLTHSSGLAHYWNVRYEVSRARLRRVADFIPLFSDEPLAFEPGEQYSYSNSGYILLGAVIEAVSGEDYFDYVREHIYQPADMPGTDAFELDRNEPNLATGYTHNGLDDRPEFGARRNNLFMHVVKGGPAGGAFSTVHDLHHFSRALLGHQLVGEEYTDALLSPQMRIGKGVEKQYGYGFMITYVNGRRIVGHSGTFPGIGARLDMYLDHGYTVVILSNYDPYVTQAIGNRMREWIAGY